MKHKPHYGTRQMAYNGSQVYLVAILKDKTLINK